MIDLYGVGCVYYGLIVFGLFVVIKILFIDLVIE